MNKKQKAKSGKAVAKPSWKTAVPAYASVALVCALVLFQGGFYPGAVCAVGLVGVIAIAVWSVVEKPAARLPLASVLLAVIAVWYALSSLVHGASASMLLETGKWFALAGMALWCSFQGARDKRRALEALAWATVVLAVLGLLMFAQVIPMEGTVSANRLMFTFQYANAAGVLFAVGAVLCLSSGKTALRVSAIVPVAALLVTKSGGAIAVFVLALIALGVQWAVTAKPAKPYLAGATCAFVAACVIAGFLLRDRMAEAVGNFVERVVHVLDGLSVLAGNPLFGIGPNQWQFMYPTVQTGQYRASVVHASYLQIGIDAGVVALVVFIALLVCIVVRLVRQREFVPLVCVGMVALHALVDFDFQFASMVLLVMLLGARVDEGPQPQPQGRASQDASGRKALLGSRGETVARWVLVAVTVLACAGSVYLDMQATALQNAAVRGDADAAYAQLESNEVLASDPALQEAAIGSLYANGDYDRVVQAVDAAQHPIDTLELYRAFSLYQLGKNDEACDALARVMSGQPYNVPLYKSVRQFIVGNDVGERYVRVYNEQATHANELLESGNASWMTAQEEFELIGEGGSE